MTPSRPTRTTNQAGAALAAGALLAAGIASAQTDWTHLDNPTATHMTRVWFLNDNEGYAMGFVGTIIYTDDGGRSWSTKTSPGAFIITARSFPVDAQTGYIGGLNGSIYKTTDGATSWALKTNVGDTIWSMEFPVGDQVGYVSGDAGLLVKTVDGGENWITNESNTIKDIAGFNFPVDATVGYCVGNDEVILKRDGCRMLTGTYTGDGADDRAITGLGFAPDFLFIKGDLTEYGAIKTSNMPDDESKLSISGTALVTNRIQTLDADGFTLGSDDDVNKSGESYYWAAFREVAGEMDIGSYTGTGAALEVTGLGFQPDYVMTIPAINKPPWQRNSAMVGDMSLPFGSVGSATNRITSFSADGFWLGTHVSVNSSGDTFYYAAWKQVAGKVGVGKYDGDDADDRDSPSLGFQPELVMIKADATESMAIRPESLPGDAALDTLNIANTSNTIQQLDTDSFQLGDDAQVNASSTTYYYAAFGGAWTDLSDPGAGLDLADCFFPEDETVGYLCGESGTVWKTTDGGATWNDKSTPSAASQLSIWFTDDDRGWVCGGSYIGRTEDGGDTWTAETVPAGATTLLTLQFPEDGGTGYLVGYYNAVQGQGTVLRTTTPLFKTGMYTGNATAGRAITGLGFQPDVVMIQGNSSWPVMRTSTMAGDMTKELGYTTSVEVMTGAITSLDADGFTIGADKIVNKNNEVYFWWAAKADHEIAVGSYTGDGVNGRKITDVGFSPDQVIVFAEEDAAAGFKLSSMATLDSAAFTAGTPQTGYIQLMLDDGFKVSANEAVNEAGYTYHWVAIKNIANQIATGSYTGDGWDDVSIGGLGFEPDWVMIKADAAQHPIHRFRSMGRRDTSLTFENTGLSDNRIQALEPDGFQVGSDDAVNQASETYYWFAIGRDPTQPSRTPMVLQWQEADPRD